MTTSAKRVIHHEDAIAWLERVPVQEGCSFITSLPDVSELSSLSLEEWKEWFIRAARLVLARTPDAGAAIFFQTDVKRDGAWVDKGYLVQKAAELEGVPLLWHKIVCRAPAGQTTFGRPAYSHLLAFSRGVRAEIAESTQDVLPHAGETTWTRGMGVEACLLAARFVQERTRTTTVIDPFCGHGTALAVANALGLDAIGVEIGRKRAEKAASLRWDPELTRTFWS